MATGLSEWKVGMVLRKSTIDAVLKEKKQYAACFTE
jgi:hypothetical protein